MGFSKQEYWSGVPLPSPAYVLLGLFPFLNCWVLRVLYVFSILAFVKYVVGKYFLPLYSLFFNFFFCRAKVLNFSEILIYKLLLLWTVLLVSGLRTLCLALDSMISSNFFSKCFITLHLSSRFILSSCLYKVWDLDWDSLFSLLLQHHLLKTLSSTELLFHLCQKSVEHICVGFPEGSAGKDSACNEGDLGSIPGLGRSPGEGKGHPLQYSGLENSMNRIVHGAAKSLTWLKNWIDPLFLKLCLICSH